MSVPRIIDIAAEEVVKYIVDGKFDNVDCVLPARPSNKIFGIIKKYKHIRFKKLREQVANVQFRMLRPSKMDFYRLIHCMDDWDLNMTKKQNLVALRLGLVKSLGEYHKKFGKTKYFDVVALLEDILSQVSRRNLMELDISNVSYMLPVNWTVKIGSMLPSLNVLNMAGNLLDSEFSNLCSSFPYLTELDISGAKLKTLKGISKLRNLNVLSVGRLKLNEFSDLEELFELKKIRELRMSNEKTWNGKISNILPFFIQSNQHLPRLEILDCSGTRTTDVDLDKIIRRHPNLKKIVALYTEIERSEISGIELLTTRDLTSTVQSLAHFRQEGNDHIVKSLVYMLSALIGREPSDTQSPDGLRQAVHEINQVFRRYKYDEQIMRGVNDCCVHLTVSTKRRFYGAAEKLVLVDMILGFFEHDVNINHNHLHYLHVINKLHTPQPGALTNRACAVALNAFLEFNGKPWGQYCLEFVELSVDHVDSSLGLVIATDKRKKLVGVLRKMHRSRDLELKYKRMAGKLERLIQ